MASRRRDSGTPRPGPVVVPPATAAADADLADTAPLDTAGIPGEPAPGATPYTSDLPPARASHTRRVRGLGLVRPIAAAALIVGISVAVGVGLRPSGPSGSDPGVPNPTGPVATAPAPTQPGSSASPVQTAPGQVQDESPAFQVTATADPPQTAADGATTENVTVTILNVGGGDGNPTNMVLSRADQTPFTIENGVKATLYTKGGGQMALAPPLIMGNTVFFNDLPGTPDGLIPSGAKLVVTATVSHKGAPGITTATVASAGATITPNSLPNFQL